MTEQEVRELFSNGYEDIGAVVSNFDGVIDTTVEEKLKTGKFAADFPAWNFHANVWYDQEKELFAASVLRYHSFQGVFFAPTVSELRTVVSDQFGYE